MNKPQHKCMLLLVLVLHFSIIPYIPKSIKSQSISSKGCFTNKKTDAFLLIFQRYLKTHIKITQEKKGSNFYFTCFLSLSQLLLHKFLFQNIEFETQFFQHPRQYEMIHKIIKTLFNAFRSNNCHTYLMKQSFSF